MSNEDRPINYHTVLLPTRNNYYSFISTIEKFVINNLKTKTFTTDSLLIKEVGSKTDKGNNKGTIVLLSEWFSQNVKAEEMIKK